MGRQIIAVIVFVVLLVSAGGDKVRAAEYQSPDWKDATLVVPFYNGKSTVSDPYKIRIKQMLDDLQMAPGDKILVLGYTDNRGNARNNLTLSNKRAQAVGREIIHAIGGKLGKDVLAIGRGAENPVADNGSQSGRARNRRAEIYYAQMVSGQLMVNQRRLIPDSDAVEKLVHEARSLLHRQQLQEALRVLREAHAQGADRYSNWNGLYGIAGYYTGMAPEIVRNHLSLSLRLDPFNSEAREYLGRLEARDRVAAGTVTPAMGRNPKDPLKVLSDSQIHEYLRLFDVQALSHAPLAGGIEVWRCRDANGNMVVYHFDRSKVYSDLYLSSVPDPQTSGHSAIPGILPSGVSGGGQVDNAAPPAAASEKAAKDGGNRIRELTIFP